VLLSFLDIETKTGPSVQDTTATGIPFAGLAEFLAVVYFCSLDLHPYLVL
jgi:hypothetical protein